MGWVSSTPPGALGTYLQILRHGPAARPFAASVVARLVFAMAPLSMVLLVSDVRDSYQDAGIVTAAYALGGAVSMPFLGRLMDRVGLTRVLGCASVTSGVFLALLALTAAADEPLALLIALAAGAGLAFPPLSPAMRVVWRVALPEERLQRAGYALDAAAVETIFVGGPVLLSVLITQTPRPVPLLVTAALLVTGSLALATSDTSRSWQPDAPTPASVAEASGAIALIRGMPPLLLVLVALAIAFGAIDTTVAATARDTLHDQSKLGVLYLALAGGSAVGGLLYGAYASHRAEQRRLPVTLGGLALGLLLTALLLRTDPLPLVVLLLLLLVTGLCIAPTIIIAQNLIDLLAPATRSNEAQSWLSTSITAGAAGGTAVAGAVIDASGVPSSFGCAAAAALLAAVVAAGAQRRWRGALPPVAVEPAEPPVQASSPGAGGLSRHQE